MKTVSFHRKIFLLTVKILKSPAVEYGHFLIYVVLYTWATYNHFIITVC